MSETTEAPAYAAAVDRTGRWWVTAPDGAAYRFGGGPRGRDAAQGAARRASEGGAIGVPPWPSTPPDVRPGNESVDVAMRGSDVLDDDTYEDVTRAAADGYDERLWHRRGF